ncbi:MAG: VTT domain-containing protein [Planctomycetota bacterium]|nr:VTT domain-containing protein [Planctomycetota bacterium]
MKQSVWKNWWVWKLLAAAAGAVGLVVALHSLPVRHWLLAAMAWSDGMGAWAPVAVVGIYVVAYVLMVPATVMTVGAGVLFKLGVGCVTVSAGTTLGAAAAFLIGRSVFRPLVVRRLAGHPRFAAVDAAIGDNGFKVVLLTRLSPAPSFVMNYLFSLTRVRFGPYLLASWLGMLPRTLVWVYVGTQLRRLIDVADLDIRHQPIVWIYFGCALIMLVILALFCRRLAERSLAKLTRQS